MCQFWISWHAKAFCPKLVIPVVKEQIQIPKVGKWSCNLTVPGLLGFSDINGIIAFQDKGSKQTMGW